MREGFGRFWNATAGYCYDVIDGLMGHDDALRPNQIFAVSLAESPLPPERQRQVVDACARHLLTSFGLRSLAPGHPQYHGGYCGGPKERDAVYHQGPAWAWLLGPFALAHLRVYGDPAAARAFLEPLAHHLDDYGVGSIAEIFEGDPPFPPARVRRPGVERVGDAAGMAGDRGRARPDAGDPPGPAKTGGTRRRPEL